MIPLPTTYLAAIAAAIVAAAGFAGGWAVQARLAGAEVARARAAVAECQAGRERDARAAAEETARKLTAAQAAERAAAANLHSVQETLNETDRRLRQALARVARADRVCLSADTRSVLDHARSAAHVPTGASGSHPADAGASADSGGPGGAASERAVAEWAATAIRLYDECRARINAIRQWDELTYDAR
jgi:hypothetical protein